MISKYRTHCLIDEYAPLFVKHLGIKTKIKFHVFNSESRNCPKPVRKAGDNKGLSYISSQGSSEIVIFNDKHNTERDTVATILHELLHVRIAKLTHLVTIEEMKAYSREEAFVTQLEKFIMKYYWKGQ